MDPYILKLPEEEEGIRMINQDVKIIIGFLYLFKICSFQIYYQIKQVRMEGGGNQGFHRIKYIIIMCSLDSDREIGSPQFFDKSN